MEGLEAVENWRLLEEYLKAKRAAKAAVHFEEKDVQGEQLASTNNSSHKNRTFKMAKRLKQDYVNVVGEKCVRNDERKLTLTVDDKLKACKWHYQKLLNAEFPWNASNLNDEPTVEGPAIKIVIEMVSKSINKMKAGKAAGPSGIIIEIIKVAGNGIINFITPLFNNTVYEGKVPNDWHLSYIINLVKGKEDALYL